MLKIPRTDWDTFFMLHAHLAATRSTCDRGPELLFDPRRHGVGCVIVRDRRVIAGGYNGSPPGEPHCDELHCPTCSEEWAGQQGLVEGGKCPACGDPVLRLNHMMVEGHCVRTIHSEMNALIQCALDSVTPEGADIYTTASPCFDCSKALIRAKIRRVIIGQAYESRYGLSADVNEKLRDAGIQVTYCLLTQKDFLHEPTS